MRDDPKIGVPKILVVGTCDTKRRELAYVQELIEKTGLRAELLDVSTRSPGAGARAVAACHPDGADAVFTGDRGSAVAAMARALEAHVGRRDDVAGMIGLGGSGGTALIAPAMRALPVGVPKLLVSTVASGDVAAYVGPSDLCMMYAVTDVAGLNRISRKVLGNAAHAIAGMVEHDLPAATDDKPAVGLTMFGVTTPAVDAVTAALEDTWDCLVFHATGTGGRSMEKLVDSGLIEAVIDLTTTEICDLLAGGVFPATDDRLGAVARTRVPYVGSCGALDMVNFGGMESVPAPFRHRRLHVHNPQVTLMRTNVDENRRIGAWIGAKLDACEGPVRFLLPEKGVSLLDVEGQPFFDPEADAALFAAIEASVKPTDRRRVIRLPFAIDDPEFAAAVVDQFREVTG